jgi:hypothetical protein
MNQKEEHSKYIDSVLRKGIHTNIEFADGSVLKTDLEQLFAIADMLAANYGIGIHNSFTEFVKSVDKEDPVVIAGLLNAAEIRLKAMYGIDEDNPSNNRFDRPRSKAGQAISRVIGNKKSSNKPKVRFDSSKGIVCNNAGLRQFLADWGASKDELKKVRKLIEDGKIKVPDEDFSWITPETLLDKDFDTRQVLNRMKKAREGAYNINVSLDTITARNRKNNARRRKN